MRTSFLLFALFRDALFKSGRRYRKIEGKRLRFMCLGWKEEWKETGRSCLESE